MDCQMPRPIIFSISSSPTTSHLSSPSSNDSTSRRHLSLSPDESGTNLFFTSASSSFPNQKRENLFFPFLFLQNYTAKATKRAVDKEECRKPNYFQTINVPQKAISCPVTSLVAISKLKYLFLLGKSYTSYFPHPTK